MSGSLCEIRIYDSEFNWIGVTAQAESVQFSRDLYEVGTFEIHIHPDKEGAQALCSRGNIIIINGDGHKAGIVRDFHITEDRTAQTIVVYGETGQGFCKQRITVPPTQAQVQDALGWDKINAPAETVIKHYAGRNLVNAYDAARNIPNLVMAADLGRGTAFPWKSRYLSLAEELTNICTYAEMGYEIYADLPGRQWVFDIIQGENRGSAQTKHDPVVFQVERQNIELYKYTQDYQNYKTTGYAGGQGEDENRLIYTLGAGLRGADRWETFLDCGNAEDITELIYYGEQKLNEFQQSKTLELSALPRVFHLERDFFLGDVVTVVISRLGIEWDTRITAVKEIWERPTGYSHELRFGEKLPNLLSILPKQGVVR